MHDCPCCGEDVVYTEDPADMCRACAKAGCELTEGDDGRLYEIECQVPQCPDCGTRASFMTDEQWRPNCEPDECERAWKEGNEPWN